MKDFLPFIFLLCLLCACQDNASDVGQKSKPVKTDGPLFTLLGKNETGVDFVNVNKQDVVRNIFAYHYFFNGGGVVVADFDNDDLPDLYFTANMGSDKLYKNLGNLNFKDITASSGANGFGHGFENSWSTGATIADVNNDGLLDIYVCKSGAFPQAVGRQNLLYINKGNMNFVEAGAEWGINDTGHSTQAVFFDMDQDRDLDLYVMNHSINFNENIYAVAERLKDKNYVAQYSGNLYRNDGFKKFTKITEQAGMLKYGFGLGVVASDYNHDGWTDLYVANDFSRPDFMYINNKNGTFTDVIKAKTGHISYYSMGVDIADINNDGLLDIYVVDMAPGDNLRSKTLMPSMDAELFWDLNKKFGHQYQYMFNALHLNQGSGHFSEIAKLAGVHKTDWSWATFFADFDNDGNKDLFVSNGYKRNAMDNDFNNEFVAMKARYNQNVPNQEKQKWLNKPPTYKLENQIYKNKGNLKFELENDEWGITQKSYSNGAAYADLDLDGDLDLVVNNMDQEAFIYRNNGHGRNNYIGIKLMAGGRYLPALCWNAKVTIYTNDGLQYQELSPTRGFQSVCDNILHFGLGDNDKVIKIEVIWPDGVTQVLGEIKANQILSIDKTKANNAAIEKNKVAAKFAEVTKSLSPAFVHKENDYDDFKKELLLPHKNSQHGPFLSVGDLNGDQLEDFFIGGASGQSGSIYLQNTSGQFTGSSKAFSQDADFEDMGSAFLDFDADGDLDLYVASGGNEFPSGPKTKDRLYLNNGKGSFSKTQMALPQNSASCVVTADFNGDGVNDLFVGGRMKPGEYPRAERSHILLSSNKKLVNETDIFCPELNGLGIVTCAKAFDYGGDNDMDLLVAGEWSGLYLFENTGSGLKKKEISSFADNKGWWSALEVADLDGDGDQDIIAGNLGLNYKYKASKSEPFHIYLNDFDNSGSQDIVLGYFNQGICYPLRGRECSSEQMPFIKEKFPTYHAFGSADLKEVYGAALDKAYHLEANNFASGIFRNNGGDFEFEKLSNEVQVSSINGIVVEDFDGDGLLDLLLGGNLFASEVETPRNDAGVGFLLKGNNGAGYSLVGMKENGVFIPGDVKDLKKIKGAGGKYWIAIANNDAPLQLFEKK